MTEIDYRTCVKTQERNDAVYVNKFDDNTVWLSMQLSNASANVRLSTDQAKELIAALTRIVEAA